MMMRKSGLALVTATLIMAGTTPQAALTAAADSKGVAHPELWPQAKSVGLVDANTEAFITDLMAKMTLEEKVGQMIQGDISKIKPAELRKYPLGSILAGGNSPPLKGDERGPASDWLESTKAFHDVALEPRANHVAIPLIFGIDAVHGNSNVTAATLFPHNSALGATRDPDLIRRIGVATALETAAIGVDWTFAPTITVPQDDRWGRTYEGYAENPTLVRQYAGQMVLGLQGEPGAGHVVQSGHVAASAKHFLGDGGTTDGTDQGNTQVSEADLINTHAQGYITAINAGAMTVMASYSSWQGHKMHGNKSLLTDVLKGRMGFAGFVIGDWNGHAQVPGCTKRSCPDAINAGVDMVMAPDGWRKLFENTVAQVRSGAISQSRVDDAVRRILRVKVKLGLFDAGRPFEGRFNLLGSPEHRALAREAVRKSLVLLKNNDRVLPIKANAHVLVTGPCADDIGRQSGGWTLTWQGTKNKNSDFPNAQSIYSGIREAVQAVGGSVELSADGSYKNKPDVVVVVLGEKPSAEGRGDLVSINYLDEHQDDLALLRRLQTAGLPVVTVFLSGRPLWVNPLINASTAFVAAWFPGSEGAGIADVLIGDAQGGARYEFTGKLSYSWPNSATQVHLNIGKQPYAPLFAYGYGLTYESPRQLAQLNEDPGIKPININVDKYLVAGVAAAPWSLQFREGAQSAQVPTAVSTFSSGSLSMRALDGKDAASAGRQLTWSGRSEASAVLAGSVPVNLLRQSNTEMSLSIEYRVDQAPTAPVVLAIGCGASCAGMGELKMDKALQGVPLGQWRTLKVNLSCFREAGADVIHVRDPMIIRTSGSLQLSLRGVHLEPESDDAHCLKKLHPTIDDVEDDAEAALAP
jgi:beta-glucosidase